MADLPKAQNSMAKVFGIRDFRLLFAAVSTSLLGDQFVLIATPWLVLQLTGDPLILGIVLALEGAPRALFMLIGGVITDKFSPRKILFVADIVRGILAALMALTIFTNGIELWMLYGFGLGFGLVAGFAVPAGNSIVPMLVEEKDLQAGNSLVMGVGQIMGFVGPISAGIVIGIYVDSLFGVALAFSVDAITFAVSALLLLAMDKSAGSKTITKNEEIESVWKAIKTEVKFAWEDSTLRLMFIIIAGINFLFVGPMLVGIPVLADQRLVEGALAFCILMSGFAGGNLGGYVLAGILPKPSGQVMRWFLIVLLFSFGIVLGFLGFVYNTWIDFWLMLLLGLGNGYTTIVLFTSIQNRTPKSMMGRIMSFLALASFGLVPVSQAVSGALSSVDLTLLFASSGGLIVMGTIWVMLQPATLEIGQNLADEDEVVSNYAVL